MPSRSSSRASPSSRATGGGQLKQGTSLEELWERFKETGSLPAREQLIVHYAPLVKYVASRVATGLPANVEQADLDSDDPGRHHRRAALARLGAALGSVQGPRSGEGPHRARGQAEASSL